MKTTRFLLVLVLGIMTAVCVSCSKDEDPIIIESTLKSSGMDATVQVNSNSDGTDFTYKSWVVVDQVFGTRAETKSASSRVTTRATDNGGTEISVLLTNSLKHVIDTVKVEHYKLTEKPTISIENKVGDSYPEGSYITVTDSILVYKIDYGAFVESYELLYQVATYNDGVNRFRLPHKPYNAFSVDDWTLVSQDSKRDSDGFAYASKLFTQTLSVDFDEKEYKVRATYDLRRVIETNGGPFIVKSEVLGTTIQPTSEIGKEGADYVSKIKVHQVWSDGRDVTEEYPLTLFCQMSSEPHSLTLRGDPNDRVMERKEVTMFDDNDPWSVPNEPVFGEIFEKQGELRLYYPTWQVEIKLREVHGYYDDGVTYAVYAGPVFDAKNVRIVSDKLTPRGGEDVGWYDHNVVVEVDVCGTTLKYEVYYLLKFN